jgi:hypothetical protein
MASHPTADRGSAVVALCKEAVVLRAQHLARHGLAETARFEPLELVGHGPIDDRREVAVRDLRTQERRQPFELVAQLGAGGELDLEAGGRQRLDDACA